MTYGDAVEGAKSNALMRLCKGIGISLELWKPSFVRDWKNKYAESYWDEKKRDTLWRRKKSSGSEPEQKSKPPRPTPPPGQASGESKEDGCTKAQMGKLFAMGKNEFGLDNDDVVELCRWYRQGEYLTKKESSELIENFENAWSNYTAEKTDESPAGDET
jgi:hypothetical protein